MFRYKDKTWHKMQNLIQSTQVLAWRGIMDRKRQVIINQWRLFSGDLLIVIPVAVSGEEDLGYE